MVIVLKVVEQGEGIDLPSIKNYLFEPFRRYTEKGEGKGVGLYLLKTIVEYNGGQVKLESEPGKGTSVYCYLKAYEVPDAVDQHVVQS